MSGEGAPQRGIDWPGLMRAGLHGLGLKPWEFWALTPAELALMLGIDPGGAGGAGMSRARLDELAARFPDTLKQTKGGEDGGSGRA